MVKGRDVSGVQSSTMADKSLPLAFKITISVIVILVLGSLGGFITSNSIDDWYSTLNEPPGTPPNWVFGPVWSVLYAMIGLSFALVWHRGFQDLQGKIALILFAEQLILNLAWTPVFFGAHQLLISLVVIAMLLLSILATILAFSRRSKTAALLLVPYLMWVSYATYLNAGFYALNR